MRELTKTEIRAVNGGYVGWFPLSLPLEPWGWNSYKVAGGAEEWSPYKKPNHLPVD